MDAACCNEVGLLLQQLELATSSHAQEFPPPLSTLLPLFSPFGTFILKVAKYHHVFSLVSVPAIHFVFVIFTLKQRQQQQQQLLLRQQQQQSECFDFCF